jgi:hypothetical protein
MNTTQRPHLVRAGGIAGILTTALGIGSFVAAGNSPDSTASVKDISQYLVQSRGGIVASAVLLILAGAVLCYFNATLASLVRERTGEGALSTMIVISGAIMVSLLVWDGLPVLALAFTAGQPGGLGDGAAMRALYELENGIIMPGAFGVLAAAFLVTTAVAALRGAFAARWFGYLLLAFAAVSMVGAVLGLTQASGGSASPLSYAPAFVTFPAILIAGVFMVVSSRGTRVDRPGAMMAERG